MDSVQVEDHCHVNKTEAAPPPFQSFETLLSALKDPQVLKPSLLKSLYYLLVHLSLEPPLYSHNFGASNYLDMGSHHLNLKVTFTDFCDLCNFVFEEFSQRFKQLFSGFEQASLHSDMLVHFEGLTLLLRCCMVMVQLLEFNHGFLLEKCGILLATLGKLCSSDLILHISCPIGGNKKNSLSFKRSFSRECIYATDSCFAAFVEEFDASLCFVKQPRALIPVLCSMLEVFADELLVHRRLRQYFTIADSVSCTSEKLFICSNGDSDDVMEVIAAHFLLSVSDDQASNRFLNSLFWLHGKDSRTPELSMSAAMALLGTPVMFSAPKIFQAHLISLVSRAIGINMAIESARLDPKTMNCYISAFERSVILYTQHISSLQICDHPIVANAGMISSLKSWLSRRGCHPTFESYIRPVTYNRITCESAKLACDVCPQDSGSLDLDPKVKSDLLSASIAYMKENQSVLDKSCKDEILSILNCIIVRILSGEFKITVRHKSGDVSLEEMYLLASTLKLISSSLLQIVWCLRQNGSSERLKTLQDYSLCREYDFIVAIIGSFQQFNVSLPIQKLFCDVRRTFLTGHKESKPMLMHFASMLLFSFGRGLEFLWKDCIFMMITLMNLYIFEEGNLDAFRVLLRCEEESFSSRSSLDKVSEVQVDRDSSLIVASTFQKVQMMYLRTDTLARYGVGMQDGQSETSGKTLVLEDVKEVFLGIEGEDTCNGQIFMKCMPEGLWKQSDFDDLSDFIECKQGKDYSKWLKDRERYRKWKSGKMAVVRQERKKKTRKFLTGK